MTSLRSWCSLPLTQLSRLAGLPRVIFPDCLVCPSHWAKLLEGRMRNCSALVSSSQQCLVPQNSGGNKVLEDGVGPLEAVTLGKKQPTLWEAEQGQRAGAVSPGVVVGKGGHSHTWWGNPGVGPQGLLQGDVGDLAGVSGTHRARLCRQEGGDAVGACRALPEAGEGGARDWGRGSTQLLPDPRHSHIQRVVASDTAEEGGRQSFARQAQ